MDDRRNETWGGQIFTTEIYHPNSSGVGNGSSLLNCETFVLQYNIIPSVICAILLVFGVLYAFFGYRLLKATMFVTGFLFASSVVYFVCIEERVLPLSGKIGASLGAGIVCGVLALLVIYIGLFMTGFQCGILFGLLFFTVLEFTYHPFTKWIPIAVLVGFGLVFALLILYWQRGLMMLATSLLGSGMMLLAVDYFFDAFRMAEYLYDRLTARHSVVSMCWFSWLLVAAWPALAFLCLVVQWRITAAHYEHRTPKTKKRQIGRSNSSKKPSSSESDQHHYRHLYKIRRMNGDIVSKDYVKSIEEAHRSPSLQLLKSTTEVDNVKTT